METKECNFSGFKMNGFLALFLHLVVLTGAIVFGFMTLKVPFMVVSAFLVVVWFILLAGYMQLEPNEARAIVFSVSTRGLSRKPDFSG